LADTTALTADDVAIPGTTTWNEDVAPFDIAYDWKIDGKPPVLSLQRTTGELNKKRHSGLTKPGIDLLLSAGEHADVPLRLHRSASARSGLPGVVESNHRLAFDGFGLMGHQDRQGARQDAKMTAVGGERSPRRMDVGSHRLLSPPQ
jgi:hypothetical protein